MDAKGDVTAALVHCEIIQTLNDSGDTVNIFIICLNGAESQQNIIDRTFAIGLAQVVFHAREKVKAGEVDLVVICSSKMNSFMAGADIETQLKYVSFKGLQNATKDVQNIQGIFCALESLSVPTIAILNGTTLGAGLELALSCDFRIADLIHCKQIGLPEVKLGVLPGAGGCVRLPKLIGIKKSLDLIMSGQTINSKKALKLGIVDKLFTETRTILKSSPGEGEDGIVYDFMWLRDVLTCLEEGKIGKRPLLVNWRDGTTAVSSFVDMTKLPPDKIEEYMLSSFSENWEECEEKSKTKYSQTPGFFQSIYEFFTNILLYTLVIIQLWMKVGLKFPAPYHSLQTIFRCYYSGSWMEAMSQSAQAMASLIISTEAKGLMSLFVTTRKLKKVALNFGIESDEMTLPFDHQKYSVMVLMSREFLGLSSAVIQCLLYNEIPVCVCVTDKNFNTAKVFKRVQSHFDYALKRQYMSQLEVGERMQLLSCCTTSGLIDCLVKMEHNSLILISASSKKVSIGDIVKYFTKVVFTVMSPNAEMSFIPFPILINFGDPLRKNTISVEITPLTHQVSPESLRLVSSLVSAIGKIPVITPPTQLTSCGLHVLLSHWCLAISLVSVYGGNLSAKKMDKYMLSAGYSMGPFQAMKKFGKVYFHQGEDYTNKNVLVSRLRTFIDTGTIPSSSIKRNFPLTDELLSNLFFLNNVLASLHAFNVTSGLSEASIDILSVTGLVQFPPTEGGPLNFAARLGRERLISMYELCIKAVPFLVDISGAKNPRNLLAEENLLHLYNLNPSIIKLPSTSEQSLLEIFQLQRSELILMNQNELRQVRRSEGVTNKELFLFPFLFVSSVGMSFLILFLSVIILYLLVY